MPSASASSAGIAFALACAGLGLLMPLGTEFLFVRDLFNSRMNSVFKLYYQSWTLLSIAGGFAIVYLWQALPRRAAVVWAIPTGLLIAGGFAFTFAATYTRTNRLQATSGLSLDGLRWWRDTHPGDLEAAAWISDRAPRGAVILEAYADGGYTHVGRISMATGRPTLLGWSQHEHQWRGHAILPELDRRKQAVRDLYGSAGDAQALDIIDRFGIQYVVVGPMERAQGYYSPEGEARFGRIMDRAFISSDGQTSIFTRRTASQ
jgi:uncharacterized membrane protein